MEKRYFFFSVGSIILDDIVMSDGQTSMGVLGGGSTHAAMGMRVWTDHVGLVAAVGHNFPESLSDEMAEAFDVRGVRHLDINTPRAWQVIEADGFRTEVFRSDFDEFITIDPQPEDLPESYWKASGVHLQCAAPFPLLIWVDKLRSSGNLLILWEPWDEYLQLENREQIRALLPRVDVFSPGLSEAGRLTQLQDPIQIVGELLDDGAPIVALRMGANGSLVGSSRAGIQHVPAYPVDNLVDVTGAGNSYCGGFLVGLEGTGDPLVAGQYGTVSASITLEQFGALVPIQGLRKKAQRRFREVK
jgi:sugar/nucleoside kinase (ribokinase family)